MRVDQLCVRSPYSARGEVDGINYNIIKTLGSEKDMKLNVELKNVDRSQNAHFWEETTSTF
jgi:hypothetical protein